MSNRYCAAIVARSPVIALFSKTRLKYYFNTAHCYQDLHCSLMYRCPTAVLITRDTAKSAFHYNLYTLYPAITCRAVHCQLSNIPLHCTQLLPLAPLSIRGSRPICSPRSRQFAASQFSSNLSAVLPFIVVTVPGVHHLLSLIQCSFHVFKTTFPIPLTFFHPLPVLSISNAVHSHLPFFTIHAAFCLCSITTITFP